MDDLLDYLKCPACGHGRYVHSSPSPRPALRCRSCGRSVAREDGIYLFDLPAFPEIDYRRPDWREREAAREQLARERGFDDDWLRSLPFPALERETSFQPKGGVLGLNFFELLSRLRIEGTERVLDLGAGCCWTSREFARLGCSVVSADICRVKYYGLRSAEVYLAEGARLERLCWSFLGKLPFRDGTFDLVFCQNAFQYARDLAGVSREVHRVLVPGGRLVLSWTGSRGLLKSRRWGPGHNVLSYLRHLRRSGFSAELIPPRTFFENVSVFSSKGPHFRVAARAVSALWSRSPAFRRASLGWLHLALGVVVGLPFNGIFRKVGSPAGKKGAWSQKPEA